MGDRRRVLRNTYYLRVFHFEHSPKRMIFKQLQFIHKKLITTQPLRPPQLNTPRAPPTILPHPEPVVLGAANNNARSWARHAPTILTISCTSAGR